MTAESKRYVCEVMLPEGSPVRSAIGRPSSNKALAKRSAAFEMCVLLRQGNHLDSNLMPTIKKYLPAMRNAHLALNMNKSDVYDMKTKPSIWERTRGAAPKELFMTVLHLEQPENLGRSSQPLALLTRTPMPEFPPIPLYLKINQKSFVICTSIVKSLVMTTLLLKKLNDFTLCMYKDIFNKKFEDNIPDMSYWIAPILNRQSFDKNTEAPEALIDWQTLDFVHEHDNDSGVKWTPETPDSELANRYLVDKWDGGRRFFSIDVVSDLKPLDPVPADAASHKYMNTIIDYSVSLFSKSRARVTWNHDQPVILAERILHRLNWLDDYTEKENAVKTRAYVCPEPLKISTVSRQRHNVSNFD